MAKKKKRTHTDERAPADEPAAERQEALEAAMLLMFPDIAAARAAQNAVPEAVVASGTRPLPGTSDADAARERVRAQRNPRRSDAAYLVDVEEAVRRQLAELLPGARQGERLLSADEARAPFVVRGLSRTVPNDEHLAAQRQRRQLMAQLGFVQSQQKALRDFYEMYALGFERYSYDEQMRAAEEYRRVLSVFAPPRAITLLKPAAEVRRLNSEWRAALGDVIVGLGARYAKETRGAMKPPDVAEDEWAAAHDAVASQLVARVVYPVLQRRIEMLGSATFEDMPTTYEQLLLYFQSYLTALLVRLAEIQDQRASAPAPAEGLGAVDVLDEALRAPLGVDQERAVELAYWINVVTLHANRDYSGWFVAWLERAHAEPALEPLLAEQRGLVGQLREFVERIVQDADDQARADAVESSRPGAPVFYRLTYTPRFDELVAGYRELVNNEIALARTEAVLAGKEALVETIRQIISAPDASVEDFPMELLQAPAAYFYVYLDGIAKSAERTLVDTTRGAGAADLLRIRRNKAAVETAIARVIGPRTRAIAPHAATDAAPAPTAMLKLFGNITDAPPPGTADEWTSFDLTYPLERGRSEVALASLTVSVRAGAARYDAETLHEHASELRAELDSNYADRVLQREIAELTYTLEHVLSPVHDEPLVVERLISDQTHLELRIELALAPVLAMRVRTTLPDKLAADDVAAQRRLEAGRFEVRWLRLPRQPNTEEQEVRRTTLAGGVTRDALLLFDPEHVHVRGAPSAQRALELAGRYRVEVRDLDADAVYRSLYEATVVMLARCPRDAQLFEPRSERAVYGECEWREHASTEQQEQFVDELRTLVRDGPQAHEALVKQRRATAAFTQRFGIAPALLAPPWGSSAATDLLYVARESDENRAARFAFATVVQRFVARFSAAFRARAVSPLTDDQLFAAVTALQFVEKPSAMPTLLSSDWRPDVLDTLPLVVVPVGADRAKLNTLINNALLTEFNVPRAEQLPVADTSLLIVDWPLATLLRALALPLAQVLQTVRERRYFARLRTLFGQFAMRYQAERYDQLTRPEVAGVYSPNDPLANRRLLTVDAAVNNELAQLSATRINVIARRWHALEFAELLVDVDSRRELERLLATKVLSTERDVALIGRRATYDQAALDASVGYTGRAFGVAAAGDRQTVWRGTHVVRSTQPSSESVLYTDDRDGEPTRAIVQRGSEPLNFNYDYEGLHGRVQHLVNEYVRQIDAPRADRAAWARQQRAVIERAVLQYNYFAFVAPPEKKFVPYEDMLVGIRNGRWGALSFAPPLVQ